MSCPVVECSCAEYAGILCIEGSSSYESDQMLIFRVWQIAKYIAEIKTINKSVRKKDIEKARNTSHLKSCAQFLGCDYYVTLNQSAS